jgi:hypothetical protein
VNSSVYLIGAGIAAQGKDLEEALLLQQSNPTFRKASRNMMTANLAIQLAVKDSGLTLSNYSEAGFILGSSYGELENTTEFLKHWVRSQMARPILFQSSLHNGTLGFLALFLSLPGPSFSISQRYFSGEKALEAGADLIRAGIADLVLVSAVDVMSELLFPALKSKLRADLQWRDGASAVVLASADYIASKQIQPKAEFLSLRTERPSPTSAQATGEFYDSDGLQKWITAIQGGGPQVLALPKPDGSVSRIEWR